MTWQARARCVVEKRDPNWFFPKISRGDSLHYREHAQAVMVYCAQCPVRMECWEDGEGMQAGFWGGVDRDHERVRKMRLLGKRPSRKSGRAPIAPQERHVGLVA